MSASSFLLFRWRGDAIALPASEVTSIVDDPAVSSLVEPLGTIAKVVAHGSELCPLLQDSSNDLDGPIVVMLGVTGNVAVRPAGEFDMGDSPVLDDGTSATVRDREAFLAEIEASI